MLCAARLHETGRRRNPSHENGDGLEKVEAVLERASTWKSRVQQVYAYRGKINFQNSRFPHSTVVLVLLGPTSKNTRVGPWRTTPNGCLIEKYVARRCYWPGMSVKSKSISLDFRSLYTKLNNIFNLVNIDSSSTCYKETRMSWKRSSTKKVCSTAWVKVRVSFYWERIQAVPAEESNRCSQRRSNIVQQSKQTMLF